MPSVLDYMQIFQDQFFLCYMKKDISVKRGRTVVRQCFQNTFCGMCLLTMSYFLCPGKSFNFIKDFFAGNDLGGFYFIVTENVFMFGF